MAKVNLNDAFFPVELRPLFWEKQSNFFGSGTKYELCKNLRAVVDIERDYVFAPVTTDYLLYKNKRAWEFAVQDVATSIFKSNAPDQFECVHLYLSPSNRAVCEMDLTRRIQMQQPLLDGWCAFIRIINSYNKTKKVCFNVGFFKTDVTFNRSICLFFPELQLYASAAHSGKEISLEHDIIRQLVRNKNMYDIERIEQAFIDKIDKLKGILTPESMYLAWVCKIFNIKKKTNLSPFEKYDMLNIRDFVNKYADIYIEKHGDNAYAFLHLLADFATNCSYSKVSRDITLQQQRMGRWVDDFISEVGKPNFSISKYLSAEFTDTAYWLETLKA